MAIHAAVQHLTQYSYDKAVHVSPQIIRLRPAPHARTPVLGYSMKISPENYFINWQQDPFGNYLARVVFPDKIDHLRVEVEVIVDMISINPFDFFLEEYAESFPFSYPSQLHKELGPYLELKEQGPLLLSWLEKAKVKESEKTIDMLVRLNQRLQQDINYSIRMEPGVQDCETTLGRAIGSCRDSAWLLVQVLRHMGLAARFVSGYLIQLKADEKSLEGPSGPEEDFNDLHAWAEVYIPGAGWIGLDPTSGLFAGEGHIPLAATPDPQSAAPISGFTDPCEVSFHYKNEVHRIYESARVTKPYTEEVWKEIIDLGEEVDKVLVEEDVRLTMGGEPTFVGVEGRDLPEWNEVADGKDKRKQALDLVQKLKGRFAPEGFIHFGQGKWYPGEPLPRWQYAIFWRKDGKALWKNPKWLALPSEDLGMEPVHAKAFMAGLCQELGIDEKNGQACFEDLFYFEWEKSKLPIDFEIEDLQKDESLVRQKLGKLLERGLDQPAGFVLPIDYDYAADSWKSCFWPLKRNKLFLIPGNSPIGLRLPLDSLPALSAEEEEIFEPSPLESADKLPEVDKVIGKVKEVASLKTALCVEAREGNLYVFMPPLKSLEAYMALIQQLEKVAESLALPIIIEGYHPPHDVRLDKLIVAPDPGVVEVNIHPAHSWKEILENYEVLFEKAKESKLSAEKFMLDGRHTGTGGGNHITLGGKTPADSPLLRRPDLLRSFVNFWQNHPSLSYLFSSAFVGPTSQAPRVDEGRMESIYELEIAFEQIEKYEEPPLWIVDRIFRNLLIDLTGNTHRAEFCIDKLYSPDSQTGRLGILEMRGFDMPPHKRMCLVQLLLIRSLLAAFWKNPYRQKLVRWGTSLHDKYLIHHYVKEDMQEVVSYLQDQGFDFQMEWLAPFFEFRFPILGQVQVKDIFMEIRAGIEPWNVLGEEMSNAGTARFVDSSVERIEVLLKNFNSDRYRLLCNWNVVPLFSTNMKETFVAGVRYKAWNPPSALHPTVGVDVPLVFDMYDSWNNRSIGGCTYHVAHPGGRNYETFPVNSYEAEGRRISRFWEYNHSIKSEAKIKAQASTAAFEGPYRYTQEITEPKTEIEPRTIPPNLDYPHTFDLRKTK
ncbi:MAG: transglutaminase family protein [Bacteroidota bacterium]